MAVVNNGGGNKLDAYLKVHIGYDPGRCIQGTRIGALAVKLTNTAPTTGLTDYQSVRSDLLDDGVTARGRRAATGSCSTSTARSRSKAPLITLDGVEQAPMSSGTDRGHSVWRVVVPILPGQQRDGPAR